MRAESRPSASSTSPSNPSLCTAYSSAPIIRIRAARASPLPGAAWSCGAHPAGPYLAGTTEGEIGMAKGIKRVTIETLHEMKRNRQRIAAVVCYDYQMAHILDRAGADVLSVGDSVGRTFLGQTDQEQTTVDMMIMFCRA